MVGRQLARSDDDPSGIGVDRGDLADQDLDPASLQAAERPADLAWGPLSGHDPEVGGGEAEHRLAVDQDDFVAGVQLAA